MFDIGFWEMAFIGIIALVVIGPERLPGVAHRVGIWVGKSRRMLNEVMSDVKKEMKEYDVDQVKTLGGEFKSASNQLKDIAQSTSDALGLKKVGSAFKQSVMSDIESDIEIDTSDSPSKPSVQKTSKAVSKKGKTTPSKTIKKTAARKPTAKTAVKKPAVRKKTTTKTTTKTNKKTASKRPAKKVASAKNKR